MAGVKNTFIEVGEDQAEREHRRTKTAPAKKVAFHSCDGIVDSVSEAYTDDACGDEYGLTIPKQNYDVFETTPRVNFPSTPHTPFQLDRALSRLKTYDGFEVESCVSCPTTPHTPFQPERGVNRLKTFDPFEQAELTGRSRCSRMKTYDAFEIASCVSCPTTPHTPFQPERALNRLKTFDPFEQAELIGRRVVSPPTLQPSPPMQMAQVPAEGSTLVGAGPSGGFAMMQGNMTHMYTASFLSGVTMAPTAAVGVPVAYTMAPPMIIQSSVPAVGSSSPPDHGEPARAQTITQHTDRGGMKQIKWIVDSRKLKANDKAIISPSFLITDTLPNMTFRIILNAMQLKIRGGATFKNLGGKGSVQLKCESDSNRSIYFQVQVGEDARSEPVRGPIIHNLENGVCGLPKGQEEWNFNRAVDPSSKTFTVCVGIL
jgi:hypothetical protein